MREYTPWRFDPATSKGRGADGRLYRSGVTVSMSDSRRQRVLSGGRATT